MSVQRVTPHPGIRRLGNARQDLADVSVGVVLGKLTKLGSSTIRRTSSGRVGFRAGRVHRSRSDSCSPRLTVNVVEYVSRTVTVVVDEDAIGTSHGDAERTTTATGVARIKGCEGREAESQV